MSTPGHAVPLGDTGWLVWRDALLRSAGFPADGLAQFADPDLAAAADELLGDGSGDDEVFAKTFDAAVARSAAAASAVAADPLLREAVTWQNRAALVALDGLVAGGGDAPRNVRRRDREKALLRYWQRYCGKNETIGFFGPVSWITVGEGGPALSVRPGPALTRERRVFFEAWAMAACGDRLAADPRVRRWWPPRLRPHLSLRGREVVLPLQPPVELSIVEAAVVARCTGRSAEEVAAPLVADPALGFRSAEDVFLLLDRLVERGLLHWDAGLPLSPAAEDVLAERIAAIGDDDLRARARQGFDRLRAARDAVAAAAGDPVALGDALAHLDAEFTEVTGAEPRRRSGQTYAGRTVVYEDTSRDVDVVLGTPLLDRLAAPLGILLQAARWLTAELGRECGAILHELHAEQGGGEVPLSDLWSLAQGLLFTGAGNPSVAVAAEFTRRWSVLFGLDGPTGAPVRVASADIAARAAELFAADRPGWPSARVHSPDIQLCAADPGDAAECLLVLGELHPASAPVDSALFSVWHPDRAVLRAGLDDDLGAARLRVLYPADYPRQTGRTRHGLESPLDRELGIADAGGADLARGVPATAGRVVEDGGELVAVFPDGASWPLLEVFGDILGAQLMDSFKLLAPAAHTPRITLDELVVARETWRTTVAATGLTEVTAERDRYLAVRRFRAALGLPDRVFLKIGTETKPCYFDLTGPLHAQVLCTMLRTARREGGDEVSVVVTELLPTPEQAWLADSAGHGHVSELRLQITDPARHEPRSPGR